jgi:hypothetical protein
MKLGLKWNDEPVVIVPIVVTAVFATRCGVVQNRECNSSYVAKKEVNRSTLIFPQAWIHQPLTLKSGANPRSKAHHWKILHRSGHPLHHSPESRD